MHPFVYLCIVFIICNFEFVSVNGRINTPEPHDLNVIFQTQQTRLLEAISRLSIVGTSSVPAPSKHLFKILEKCSDVFKAKINTNLVEHNLVTNALISFRVLFEQLDTNKMSSYTSGKIMEALNKCLTSTKTLEFRTGSCPLEIEKILVFNDTSKDKVPKKPNMPVSRQYKEFLNDLIVEVPWKIFTFCHAYCQIGNSHKEQMTYRMSRFFNQEDIQERWYRHVPDLGYLKGIISASDIIRRMNNLDAAISAAHVDDKGKINPYLRKPQGIAIDYSSEDAFIYTQQDPDVEDTENN